MNNISQSDTFLKTFLVILCHLLLLGGLNSAHANAKKPNIIWVVLEDLSNDLGVYGNTVVKTPNLDRLAKEGTYYTNAYATAPVCSTARSAFFTGMYQTSIGAHHHPSHRDDGFQLPKHVKLLTEYLREVGYYSVLLGPKQKTDFNFNPSVDVFDAVNGELKSARGAYTHGPIEAGILDKPAWKKYKKEGQGKPFFAQINYSETHRTFIHDKENPIAPKDVKIPSYYPDHDLTRRDWALYLETVQWVDKKVGRLFKELKSAGALDNTLVFIFGDHGRAMARGKQWLYDSGIQVPLIVWGQGIQAGQVSDELVSLIDLMPTSMDIAGIPTPDYMQGQIFMGKNKQQRDYIFAQRDRLDETDDRVRAVRDKRFKYIVNYFPSLPYTTFSAYKKLQYPVVTLMEQMHEKGKLTPVQANWMAPHRPAEELYDIIADPEEVNNLADNPQYHQVLEKMRKVQLDWEEETQDQGRRGENPRVIAKHDAEGAGRYEAEMKARGLSTKVSAKKYLTWWDKRLKEIGK